MKLTAGEIFEAYSVLAKIINENRALPMTGGYRLARLHMALMPEATIISEKRSEIIKELGDEVKGDGGVVLRWEVPEGEKKEEYLKRWEELASVEVEVNCQPIPLSCLGENDPLSAQDFVWLGPLVVEE